MTAGARTQLAGLVSGLMLAFTLLFLTPVFAYLPYSVMGAIIINAVTSLVDFDAASHLLQACTQPGLGLTHACGTGTRKISLGLP